MGQRRGTPRPLSYVFLSLTPDKVQICSLNFWFMARFHCLWEHRPPSPVMALKRDCFMSWNVIFITFTKKKKGRKFIKSCRPCPGYITAILGCDLMFLVRIGWGDILLLEVFTYLLWLPQALPRRSIWKRQHFIFYQKKNLPFLIFQNFQFCFKNDWS